jgi:hypothetical protein
MDMDAHFNPDALLRSSAHWVGTTEDYIGQAGYGRNQEYKARPYCQGFTYAIRGAAMEPFAAMANPPKLPPSVVNSDVAVGHVLGLECKAAFKAENFWTTWLLDNMAHMEEASITFFQVSLLRECRPCLTHAAVPA